MDTDKEKVEKIEEEQLDDVKGGFLLTLGAVLGIGALMAGTVAGASYASSAAKKK